jgi:nucleoside-diphosphate-sugar epimerase
VKVLVTGARGKIGSRAAARLSADGHTVTGTDIVGARYGPPFEPYLRADLTDYGQAIAVMLRAQPDVVVHTAGIPDPSHDPSHVVFATNTQATFNIAEAVARTQVRRLVYISSETAPGFVTAERPFRPDYLPVDEDHPVRPQDAYGLSKALGETICDALVRRSDATAVSVRPSLVLAPADYPSVRAIIAANPLALAVNQWSYVDADDLADLIALAVTAKTAGHEIVYAAQPDNIAGRPLAELTAEAFGAGAPPLRALGRPDAGGISIAKARELFGWRPEHSWRDYARTEG